MVQKLSKFEEQKFQKTKLSYDEVLKKLDDAENIYTELLGPKDEWNDTVRNSLQIVRMTVITNQLQDVEGLERQYESSYNRDND